MSELQLQLAAQIGIHHSKIGTATFSKAKGVEISIDVEVVDALMALQGPHQRERQGKRRDLPEHHYSPSRNRHQHHLPRRHSSEKSHEHEGGAVDELSDHGREHET